MWISVRSDGGGGGGRSLWGGSGIQVPINFYFILRGSYLHEEKFRKEHDDLSFLEVKLVFFL